MDILQKSFNVEKVIGKRITKRGQLEYKIKWEGFSAKHNSWIPRYAMNCDEKIKEYEMSLFNIIGVKKSAGKIKYAVRKNAKIDVVESSDLATQFPESVIGFLEGQVHFSWPQHSESSRSNQMSNNHVVFISACTNQGGQGLKYLLSRNNEQFVRVANSADMVRVAPHLVVAFLESNLDLLECKAPQKTTVYNTRACNKRIVDLGVTLFPKVKIHRNLEFERHLLREREVPEAVSRAYHPVHQKPALLKNPKKVPIGARGRKSKTILFIGITPNPDGQQNRNAPVSPDPQQAPLNLPVSPVRPPAKRTYARATSTPFATVGTSNHRPRGLSFPLPDELNESVVPQSSNANDTLLDIDFDAAFGYLHYDSSDSE